MDLATGFATIVDAQCARFLPYTYSHPLVISDARYRELKQLGLVLYTAIRHLATHYRQYLHLLPFSESDLRMLDICSQYPYRVGTFRTDFVIDSAGNIQIIEITARQPLNGYFTSGVFRQIALEQAARYGIPGVRDVYPPFFPYLEQYIGDARHLCVIKGDERLEEFRLYPTIFAAAGATCHIIPIAELADSLPLLEDAWVVEELTFREIRQFPLPVLEALARTRLHNDLRTIFFAHDKRFFRLLNQAEFLNDALQPDEQALLRKYLVPTYVYGMDTEHWDDAYQHREAYIVKHQIMGKSEQVFAGCVTDDASWRQLFDDGSVRQMVLQPFLTQRRFSGVVGEEARHDYVAGTLLYFNQEFFGPGLFRASSFPVTNKVDDRKIAPLVADVEPAIPGVNYL